MQNNKQNEKTFKTQYAFEKQKLFSDLLIDASLKHD